MQKKTKIKSLILALILTASAVSACSGTKTSETTVSSVSKVSADSVVSISSNPSKDTSSDSSETPEPRESTESDYHRAFTMGYLGDETAAKNIDEVMHSTDFKAMLSDVIQKLSPDRIDYFNSKVTDYDMKLTRGMAAVMSWYAAVCIGSDGYNNGVSLMSGSSDEGFWDLNPELYPLLFPDILENISVVTKRKNQIWNGEFAASRLWNLAYSSPVSGKQVVAWDDDKHSLRALDPFTVEDAVCAVTRLMDSNLDNVTVSLDSEEAAGNTIAPEMLEKAAKSTITSMNELPLFRGFVLNFTYDYEAQYVIATERDIKNMADWGFNCARVPIRYETLFSEDGSEARPVELERLDRLIEAAVKYNIHLNLVLTTLPGRTVWLDTAHEGDGDFDLFVNKQKQEITAKIWKYLAKRYAEIPGEYLSFAPFWEAGNPNLATGAPAPDYTSKDIANTLDLLIAAIREADDDRFIVYEVTSDNNYKHAIRDSKTAYDLVSRKYDNVRIMYNFAETAFEYYNMVDGVAEEGINIDLVHHGMFAPEYPIKIYAAKQRLDDGNSLTVDGFLPAGTVINMYVKKEGGGGKFTISEGKNVLYSESLANNTYKTSVPLSHYVPYATSEKLISFTLDKEAESVKFICKKCYLEWSGIEVILPEEYAVERYFAYSSDDREELGDEYGSGFGLKKTSTVVIAPNTYNKGGHLTIGKDITYTSEAVYGEAGPETIEAWGAAIHAFSPEALIRIEPVYIKGVKESDMLEYFADIFSMCDKYGIGWFSNEYTALIGNEETNHSEETRAEYAGYESFEIKLLEFLQEHQ